MVEDKRNAMIPRPSGAIEKVGPGPRGILTRMVSDTLALARSQSTHVDTARFKIGKYEFREPDYRQILLWAKALKLKPLTVIQRLEHSSCKNFFQKPLVFSVEDGAIVSLIWDVDLLPLTSFDWAEGLAIREMVFQGRCRSGDRGDRAPPFRNTFHLPSLLRLKFSLSNVWVDQRSAQLDLSNVPNLIGLDCWGSLPDKTRRIDRVLKEHVPTLDLTNVPNLTALYCGHNGLTNLDLSNVPNLTVLCCEGNDLTRLDLSNVPKLTELDCGYTKLTNLDLPNAPNLTVLRCRSNGLTKLDLSNVPNLTTLNCAFNELRELDLSNVPNITILDCTGHSSDQYSGSRKHITSLDLSNVPNLTKLNCAGNKLMSLDLSRVPNLTRLMCGVTHNDMDMESYGNELTELDLTKVPNLTLLSCNNNHLTELDLSNVPALTQLHCGDNKLAELDLSNLPNLTVLECCENQITRLDLSRVPKLNVLDYSNFGDVALLNVPKDRYLHHLYCGGPGFDDCATIHVYSDYSLNAITESGGANVHVF